MNHVLDAKVRHIFLTVDKICFNEYKKSFIATNLHAMNDFLNFSEERLDRQQIFYAVLGELKNILLARVVLRSCTLIRCAVGVLH